MCLYRVRVTPERPAVSRVGLVYINKQEIGYMTELLAKRPKMLEERKKRGSGTASEDQHQRASAVLVVQDVTVHLPGGVVHHGVRGFATRVGGEIQRPAGRPEPHAPEGLKGSEVPDVIVLLESCDVHLGAPGELPRWFPISLRKGT